MKKILKSILCLTLVAVMTLAAANVGALTMQSKTDISIVDRTPAKEVVTQVTDPNETVPLIVKLKDAPIYAVTDAGTKKAQELRKELVAKQDKVAQQIGELVKSEINIKYHYVMLFNGFAFEGKYGLIEQIKAIPGVADCYRSEMYNLPEEEKGEPQKLNSSVGYINADDMWALGYTGQGQTIAVIDTGIKKTHPNFAAAPESPHFNAGSIQTVLDSYELCAEERYSGTLTGTTLYNSAKIPYTFNYVTGTTDVSHASAGSDHGTHVSSIAAGNDSTVKGVAYNAQIISMQVFSGGGAYWSDIIAALEDCAYLGVDALNMSLGSDCGFSSDDEDVERVFDLLEAHGVNCAVAAGNSDSAGTGNNYSSRQPVFNIDNGVVSSPSTVGGSLSVASSEKDSDMTPSSFTSWGTTADLCIKPEIMAPGGNIYAATDSSYSYSNYSTKSGTSMASPHIAGSMVLINQYVNSQFPQLSETERMEMVNTLLMSTARPAKLNNTPRSVRVQGAGQADLVAAVSTKAYLRVDGSVRPKLEIGDDPEKTGIFSFSFDVVNFGNSPLTYNVNVSVITEEVSNTTIGGRSTYYMTNRPYNLTANCNISAPSTVTVPANGVYTVNVTVDVNGCADLLNEKYPEGTYIEGYVQLDGDVDLSIPYLGFYGDWNHASVFDREYYYDNYTGSDNWPCEWGINSAGSSIGSGSYVEFGMNPFTTTENFLLDRASISPNGDGKMDAIDTVYTYLLRNCDVFEYSITNAETGEEYLNQPIPWERKCHENSFYTAAEPVGAYDSNAITPWSGEGLADGTTVILRMTGYLDSFRNFNPEENENAVWEIPVTIDTEDPEVVYWNLQDGELTIFVRDNHYVSYVGVYSNSSCNNSSLIESTAVEENTRGALSMLTFDVGNYDQVYVKVGDYAYNFITQAISGEGGNLEPIDLAGISIAEQNVETYEGFSTTLHINRNPVDANNFTTVWTSSDENIATVRGSLVKGVVTGVAEGTVTITATCTDKRTGRSFSASSLVTVHYYPDLDDAINANGFDFHFNSSGNYAWAIDLNSDADRLTAKSTNQHASNSASTVTMDSVTLSAGDKLKFDWKVGSEANYDKFKFFVNGTQVESISGEINWTTYSYTIPTDGTYIFKWEYSKDGSVDRDPDTAWLDEVKVDYVNPPAPDADGDIDGNGVVDMSDALLAMRKSMGLITLTEEQMTHADVNGDGIVNTEDSVIIARIALGLETL